jgi:hypothetical protein
MDVWDWKTGNFTGARWTATHTDTGITWQFSRWAS